MIPFVLIIGGIVAAVAGLEIVKEKDSKHKTEDSKDKEKE
jgi:small neutral amino acid transporter SnatA (MarC family)